MHSSYENPRKHARLPCNRHQWCWRVGLFSLLTTLLRKVDLLVFVGHEWHGHGERTMVRSMSTCFSSLKHVFFFWASFRKLRWSSAIFLLQNFPKWFPGVAFQASVSTSTTYFEINDPEHCGILAVFLERFFNFNPLFLAAVLLGVAMLCCLFTTDPHNNWRKSNGKLQATTVACQFQDIRCSGLTQILISLEPFNVSKTTTAIWRPCLRICILAWMIQLSYAILDENANIECWPSMVWKMITLQMSHHIWWPQQQIYQYLLPQSLVMIHQPQRLPLKFNGLL